MQYGSLIKIILILIEWDIEDNPTMKNTGFGKVGSYFAMYSFDEESSENLKKNVAWPSQNMPIEFFGDDYPWTLSVGKNISKKVEVKITNKKTKILQNLKN